MAVWGTGQAVGRCPCVLYILLYIGAIQIHTAAVCISGWWHAISVEFRSALVSQTLAGGAFHSAQNSGNFVQPINRTNNLARSYWKIPDTSSSRLRHKVEIKRRQSLSFGLRFAPCNAQLLWLFHHCSPQGGFLADLFPDPSWSPTLSNYGFLSLDILRTLASHRSLYVLTFERHIHDVRLTQLSIGDLVNLVDIADHINDQSYYKKGRRSVFSAGEELRNERRRRKFVHKHEKDTYRFCLMFCKISSLNKARSDSNNGSFLLLFSNKGEQY